MKQALLIINLGTPDSTDANDVGRYLTEFLTDKHVIDLPYPLRQFLVRALIVPKRKFASAKKYEKVWLTEGSPLLHYTKSLSSKLDQALDDIDVFFSMRYGNPKTSNVLKKISHYDEIVVLPLYPHDTKSSYLTAKEQVELFARKYNISEKIRFIKPFYSEDFFIDSWVEKLKSQEPKNSADFYLFSYHGIPLHHLPKECGSCEIPCSNIVETSDCYRAQCYKTTELIVKKMGLKDGQYMTSFQSRLGKRPWIKPYTDLVIEDLKLKGIKNLTVFSPSFIVDCLETLEELGMELKEDFEGQSDEFKLNFITCLNDEDLFVNKLGEFIKEKRT